MADPDPRMRPNARHRIVVRQQAGLPDLIASVLVLQQRTARVLAVLGPRGDATAAESLRDLHTRLGVDAHALAGLLDVAGPAPTPTTTKDPS